MNDNQAPTQNNTQTANPSMAPFGGTVPFANIPQPAAPTQQQVVYPRGAESAPIAISQETPKTQEQAAESQKTSENKPEFNNQSIERREQKTFYPQNQQSQQQANNQQPIAPVQPAKPQQAGLKFYGYMVAPQIANNFPLITLMKGKGKTDETRTWIYMLLDRILKKQEYNKK